MLQVKNKFKLKFFNQVDTIFPLSPIPNYHKLGLGDIGNWESTEVYNVILNNIIFITAIFKPGA